MVDSIDSAQVQRLSSLSYTVEGLGMQQPSLAIA